MSAEAVKTLVQAFISCRLDYCNSLKVWCCSPSRMRLHVWCRALDVTTTPRQCYRSCTGSTLGGFQEATLVYLSLSGMSPAYLDAYCQLVSHEGRSQLRSATSRTCVVRRTYSNYGDRCFVAAGPKLWNSLPTELRQSDISFRRFKRLLKTFVFGCWDRGALWLTVKAATHKFSYLLTYLLTYLQKP